MHARPALYCCAPTLAHWLQRLNEGPYKVYHFAWGGHCLNVIKEGHLLWMVLELAILFCLRGESPIQSPVRCAAPEGISYRCRQMWASRTAQEPGFQALACAALFRSRGLTSRLCLSWSSGIQSLVWEAFMVQGTQLRPAPSPPKGWPLLWCRRSFCVALVVLELAL